jgi:hypothetical protein
MRGLRDCIKLKADTPDGDLAWLIVLDGLMFNAEAEIRWLDACEARLARHNSPAGTKASTPKII